MTKKQKLLLHFSIFTATVAAITMTMVATADEIVVYSARNEQLIKPLFDAYTKETGVSIKFVTDKEGALLQKIKAEGVNTLADVLITSDAGNLWQASNLGLLQSVKSKTLLHNIPANGLVCRYVLVLLFTTGIRSSDPIYQPMLIWVNQNGGRACVCVPQNRYITNH